MEKMRIEHTSKIRVSYHDTDQMGYVHHSNYARYYETARWDLFRKKLNITYKDVESGGHMLPVTTMNFKFIRPALYDDVLQIQTTLSNAHGPRIWFEYKIFNQNNELINQAEVVLAFIIKETRRPCLIPEYICNAIKEASEIHENIQNN
mgnify:CR=1 FL=1